MVGRIGLPRWDRARVFVDGTGQIYGRSADGDSATIVFIPFVRPEDGFVNSLLSFRMTQSDTAWRGISDWQYDNLGYDTIPPDTSRFCARDAFNLIATMDQAVFGTTEFEITNGQIFGRDETDTLWATFNSPGGSGRAVGMQRSNFVSVSLICNTIEVCEPTTRGFRSASNGTNCYQAQQCTMIWSLGAGEGWWPWENGGGGGAGGGYNPPECQGNQQRGSTLPGCPPRGWRPRNNNPPPVTEPVDTLLKRYSRALKDTAVYVYDNLSQPNNVEYALTGVWQDNQIKIIERRTNNDSLQVFPKVMIGNLTLLFTWHSHVSGSVNLSDRGSFSSDDIDMLRNVRCLKQNFISFADCRNKRYAFVITDVAKASLFFANHSREDILDLFTANISGTKQEVEEQCIRNVIGTFSTNGISFYVSNDSPDFQSWTLLNP